MKSFQCLFVVLLVAFRQLRAGYEQKNAAVHVSPLMLRVIERVLSNSLSVTVHSSSQPSSDGMKYKRNSLLIGGNADTLSFFCVAAQTMTRVEQQDGAGCITATDKRTAVLTWIHGHVVVLHLTFCSLARDAVISHSLDFTRQT